MRFRFCSALTTLMAAGAMMIVWSAGASAQQLLRGVTGGHCSSLGGRILTWTNTAGQGVQVGECWVPPQAGGGGYSGGGGGSGGGSARNAAIANGLIGAGAAIGTMIDNAQRRAAEREAAQAAREAACSQNYANAKALNEQGNDLAAKRNPAGAVAKYQAAIAYLQPCNDSHNIAVISRNLASAQREYQAVRPDNRVAEAKASYGSLNPYATGSDPFAAGSQPAGGSPAAAAAPSLRLTPGGLFMEAKKRCAHVEEESEDWKSCMRRAQGEVIRDYEPEIAGHCGWDTNPSTRNECHINRYYNTLEGLVKTAGRLPAEEHIYEDFYKPARPPLRDDLRRRLQERLGSEPAVPYDSPRPAEKAAATDASGAGTTKPPPPKPKSAKEEILQSLPDSMKGGELPPGKLQYPKD